MRAYLDVDRFAVVRPMTPGTRDHEIVRIVFDHQRRDVFARADVVDRYREKLLSRVAVSASCCFVDGEEVQGFFVVDPDRLWRRLEKQTVTFLGVAQRFLEAFSFGDIARETAKTDRFVELVLNR